MQLGREIIIHEYADFILSATEINSNKLLNFECERISQNNQHNVNDIEKAILNIVLCIFEFGATRQNLNKSQITSILNEVFGKKTLNTRENYDLYVESYMKIKNYAMSRFMNSHKTASNHYLEYNDKYITMLGSVIYELLYTEYTLENETKNELLIALEKIVSEVYYETLAYFDKYEYEPEYRFKSRNSECAKDLKNYPYLLNGMAEELALTIVNAEKEGGIAEKDRSNFEELKELATYHTLFVFCWCLAKKYDIESYAVFIQEHTLVKMFPDNGVPYEVYYKKYLEYVKSVGNDILSCEESVWRNKIYNNLYKKEIPYTVESNISLRLRAYTKNKIEEFSNIKFEETTQLQDNVLRKSEHTTGLVGFFVFLIVVTVLVALFLFFK